MHTGYDEEGVNQLIIDASLLHKMSNLTVSDHQLPKSTTVGGNLRDAHAMIFLPVFYQSLIFFSANFFPWLTGQSHPTPKDGILVGSGTISTSVLDAVIKGMSI